jgi:hypothetical protein
MGWLLIIGAIGLAVAHSPWWWLLVAPLGLWRFVQWQTHSTRPWRRLHYPLMRQYAAAAGMEQTKAEQEGRPFNVVYALGTLVMQAEGISFVEGIFHVKMALHAGFTDEDEARVLQKLAKPNSDPQLVRQASDELRSHYRRDDNAVKVRLVIASIIERQLGPEHRAEYLMEAAQGHAT